MSVLTETTAKVLRTAKSLRERRGWDQAALAAAMRRAGTSWHQTTVSKVERGERALTVDELARLAQAFGAELDISFDEPKWPSVVMWRAPAPEQAVGGPGEWLYCPACGEAKWFPHGGHGRALLVEALDEHLTHRGGGGRG